ncbi:hypothetical protein BDV96DRAFT_601421 [Lophiotrema nucula]|uniref:Uncharacterized protein n=1 Tax=Lophiotrema nucula TaxID=690887 RepID=A0A6A5Z2F0_9PLEO|nr:hypothetical protein BDV96DRAFT_601421 [Lophiotrema nucula]
MTRMVLPHFDLHTSDTLTDHTLFDLQRRNQSARAAINKQWNSFRKRAGIKPREAAESNDGGMQRSGIEETRSPEGYDTEEREQRDLSHNDLRLQVHKLRAFTYRPHRIITEVEDDTWGTAAEERLTMSSTQDMGSQIYILFFDKSRSLQDHTQIATYNDSKAHYDGFLNFLENLDPRDIGWETVKSFFGLFLASDDTSRLDVEKEWAGNIHPTFLPGNLTCDSAKRNMDSSTHLSMDRHGRNHQSLQDSKKPCFALDHLNNVSSRKRFVNAATKFAPLLDGITNRPKSTDLLPTLMILCARMLAEDWNLSSSPRTWSHPIIGDNSAVTQIHEGIESLAQVYRALAEGIQKIEQRVDRSFQAIMSSMSILESERAISQGTAVTRLTELAFVFIPLSFAATFFSMQVQEFDGSRKPRLGHFYVKKRIRDNSKVPGTDKLPTRIIISYIWRRFGIKTRIFLATTIAVRPSGLHMGTWITSVCIGMTILGVLLWIIACILIYANLIIWAIHVGILFAWNLPFMAAVANDHHRLSSPLQAFFALLSVTGFIFTMHFIPPFD